MALKEIREALQSEIPETWGTEDDEDVVLVGYVIVAEWAGTEGRRWLTSTAGDINDDGPAIWTVKGWLGHAHDNADDYAVDAEEDE